MLISDSIDEAKEVRKFKAEATKEQFKRLFQSRRRRKKITKEKPYDDLEYELQKIQDKLNALKE